MMNMSAPAASVFPKTRLRRELANRMCQLTIDVMQSASEKVCRRLAQLESFRDSRAVALFAARNNEINLEKLADEALVLGKIVCYPRYNALENRYELAVIRNRRSDLIPGQYGIFEPNNEAQVIGESMRINQLTWLIPGLAFDEAGHRLGRGRGHYDRLLEGALGTKIGVGYDWQIVAAVPVDDHDILVNSVVTDKRHLVVGNFDEIITLKGTE